MQASQIPTLVPLAFAANGTKNAIPEASQIGITPGAASLNDGFPPLTFTPIAAGGVPPAGGDFNGVLYLITQTIRWKHAGGQFAYNSTFASDPNVGGYPNGAVLLKASLQGLWMSTADNNTANPDTGGANWVDLTGGRLIKTTVFTSSGTFTSQPNTKAVRLRGTGAGASGGPVLASSSTQISVSAGGASGNWGEYWLTAGFAGGVSVTIGAGGVGTTSAGANGGQTSFGTVATFHGGGFGGSTQISTSTSAGVASIGPGASQGSDTSKNPLWVSGGNAGANGIVFGPAQFAVPGLGGSNPYGSGGGGNGIGQGGSGGGYGGGGGGSASPPGTGPFAGGAGSNGILIVEEYAW